MAKQATLPTHWNAGNEEASKKNLFSPFLGLLKGIKFCQLPGAQNYLMVILPERDALTNNKLKK
jgi:hypothetical protein